MRSLINTSHSQNEFLTLNDGKLMRHEITQSIKMSWFIHLFTVTHWINVQHCTVAYDSLQTIKYDWIVCLFGLTRTYNEEKKIGYFLLYRSKIILVKYYRNLTDLCTYTALQCHTNGITIIIYMKWSSQRVNEMATAMPPALSI